MKQEDGWVIWNADYGLYCGWALTRSDAIDMHIGHCGLTWEECRKRGDRAVKITITYNDPEVKR